MHCSVRVLLVKDQLGLSVYRSFDIALQTYLHPTPQLVPMDEELSSGGYPQRQVCLPPDVDVLGTERYNDLSFPHGIPTGTAIPDWAFIPIDGFVSIETILIRRKALTGPTAQRIRCGRV